MKVAGLVLCIVGLALATPIEQPGWRIIGGDVAADGQFPHQISLRDGDFHICGGSILDETTVLCAAHCITGGARGLNVVTGTNKLNAGGDVYKVKSVKAHEDYDAWQLQQDISIIKLESPIQFNAKVQPIKLRQSFIEGGETVTLSGWGSTRLGGASPNDLQFINLNSLSTEQCRKDQTNFPILESQVCTFTKRGEGACHGDSGGPLIDSNGEQVGVVSWGTPCAEGEPDVFTRVYSFLDWIEANK